MTTRRLTTALVAACLLGATTVPAIAQEPSAAPSFGGRVESAEDGVAVTFPEDWLTFDLAGDIEARVESIQAALGDVFPADRDTLVADLERRSQSSAILGLSLDDQACDLRVVPSQHIGPLDPAFQARLDTAIGAEPGIRDYTGVAPLDHPAGPAISYSWVQVEAGADGEDYHHTGYMVDGGELGVVFTCEGVERSEDDWLAMAETIEFPPAPAPLEPVGIGGRVEVPAAGFALTLPDDWVWARHTGLDIDTLVERLAALTDPGYAAENRLLMAEVEDFSPLIIWPRHAEGSCVVGVYQTDRPLERVVYDAVDYIEANDDLDPDGVTVTELVLGGADAARLDYTQADPDWPPPSQGRQYMLVRDGANYYIGCVAELPPDDRWLSIAETLEFLPAEQ